MTVYKRFEMPDLGTYQGKLISWKDVEKPGWDHTAMSFTGPIEPRKVFVFEIYTESKTYTCEKDNFLNIGPQAGLVKDLSSMAPGKVTKELLKDDAKIDALIDSLLDQTFLIEIGLSKTGRPKITKIMAPPKGGKPAPEQPSKQAILDDSDDIPF